MNNNKGFTLIQTVVTVAVVGVLAAIASVSYGKHLAKAQVSEAISMLEQHKVQSMVQLTKNGTCDNSTSVRGKYGEISVSGTVVSTSLNTTVQRKTGCMLTYTFNNTDVVSSLKGKKIVVDLYNNSVLSKSSQTNVDASALPKVLTTLTEDALPPKSTITTEAAYVAKDTDLIETAPTGAETPPEVPSDCPKYTGYMTCHQDTGYIDCTIYTDSSRKVIAGNLNGGYPVSTLLLATAQRTATFAFNNGRCPQTTEEVADNSLGGARVSCSLVKPLKLQLIDRCK